MQMLAVVLFSTNILAVPLAVSHLTHYKKNLKKKNIPVCQKEAITVFPCSFFAPMKTLRLLYRKNVAIKVVCGTRKSVSRYI